jgi:GDP-4-dehydro-6-deoxy-D-mannose reductase
LRVLITGASGLAGGYLARACHEAGEEVLGVSRRGTVPPDAGTGRALDLCDAPAVRDVVASFAPEVVYHLAALSSVGRSWSAPAQTMRENVGAAVNLLEALCLDAPSARVLWVSSCEVYGVPTSLPIPEDAPLMPPSPYAVSKAAGDQLAGIYADAYGLSIVRARPFSHAGPGQRPTFLLSSVARQLVSARRAGVARVTVRTGNENTRRDFTDVRDVVRAYRLLVTDGAPGAVYNVSTGRSVSTAEQVALAASLVAPLEVEHVVDPAQVRAQEIPDLRGSPARLHEATGWAPEIPLRQTWADTIAWWDEQLAAPALSH